MRCAAMLAGTLFTVALASVEATAKTELTEDQLDQVTAAGPLISKSFTVAAPPDGPFQIVSARGVCIKGCQPPVAVKTTTVGTIMSQKPAQVIGSGRIFVIR